MSYRFLSFFVCAHIIGQGTCCCQGFQSKIRAKNCLFGRHLAKDFELRKHFRTFCPFGHGRKLQNKLVATLMAVNLRLSKIGLTLTKIRVHFCSARFYGHFRIVVQPGLLPCPPLPLQRPPRVCTQQKTAPATMSRCGSFTLLSERQSAPLQNLRWRPDYFLVSPNAPNSLFRLLTEFTMVTTLFTIEEAEENTRAM